MLNSSPLKFFKRDTKFLFSALHGLGTHQLESVAEAQPLLLHEHLKAPDGAVVAIQHEQGQRGQLGCAVPAVAAVNHHRCLPRLHFVSNPKGSSKNELGQEKKQITKSLWNRNYKWKMSSDSTGQTKGSACLKENGKSVPTTFITRTANWWTHFLLQHNDNTSKL